MNKASVMGIVNVTPDSFSDGGKYFRPEEAASRAWNLVEDGADIIDLGGESTRPGATPIGWRDEWARLAPVMEILFSGDGRRRKKRAMPPVSVDTYHPETAEAALLAGASIVNCVYAEPIEDMARLCAAHGAELVLPASAREALAGTGLAAERTYIDPMIGFGTTREEDLALLRSVPELAKSGRVLVGASRKRIVKKLTGEKTLGKNAGGSVAVALWCAIHGASVVRVHDVRDTVQALAAYGAIAEGRAG